MDPLEEAVALAPAAHALEQGPRHVLEGEVEVGHAGRQYGLDQGVVEGGRDRGRAGGSTGPARPPGHQVDDRTAAPHGRAVEAGLDPAARAVERERRQVLGHQHDLGQGPAAAPSSSTSARIEAVERDRCLPRNEGMAQKPQLRSHPSATLT